MNLRPTLALGALAFAAIVGVAFALDATLGTPTAHASGPDREIDDPWIEDPPEQSDATIQCWIVIKESNVEGSNICSPGAHAKSVEKSVESHEGDDGTDGRDGGDDGPTTETTVCQSEGLIVSQQCDVDGDAESEQVFVGLPFLGQNGAGSDQMLSQQDGGYESEPEEGGDSETTVCVAEGGVVSQQCDVDGDAESHQVVIDLGLLRGPVQLA